MDADFAAIRAGLLRLQSIHIPPGDLAAEAHRYRLNPPLSEDRVRRFEAERGIALPPEYRAFLSRLGNGGAGPAYGVFKLGEVQLGWESTPLEQVSGLVGSPAEPFPHTAPWNDHSDQASYEGPIDGALPLSTMGCGSLYWMVVTGPESGHIWCDNRADYAGLSPMGGRGGSRLTFLPWYREWLDRELEQRGLGVIQAEPPAAPDRAGM